MSLRFSKIFMVKLLVIFIIIDYNALQVWVLTTNRLDLDTYQNKSCSYKSANKLVLNDYPNTNNVVKHVLYILSFSCKNVCSSAVRQSVNGQRNPLEKLVNVAKKWKKKTAWQHVSWRKTALQKLIHETACSVFWAETRDSEGGKGKERWIAIA